MVKGQTNGFLADKSPAKDLRTHRENQTSLFHKTYYFVKLPVTRSPTTSPPQDVTPRKAKGQSPRED